ncbi:MAG: hypothetical protein PHD88_03650 [Firmicutes bacterium]|nr:hypothetical protein [Bacillota bacterium]MDD4262873.1 hypothetical protein [Bacillota bacterium]MDD4693485.1 hypothetical protein [Bacillota bacterium]
MKKTLNVVFLLILIAFTASAVFRYEIDWQKDILEVDSSGQILLNKSFSFRVLPESTENGTEIWVGLPTKNTKVTNASYVENRVSTALEFRQDTSGDNYQVIFDRIPAILPGQSLEIHYTATVPDLIYWLDKKQPDEEPNAQRVALSYIPAWWDKAVVRELTLEFRFASHLNLSDVQYAKVEPHFVDTDQQLVIGYTYQNVPQETKLHHSIILPKNYFASNFEPQRDWLTNSQITVIVSIVVVLVLLFGAFVRYLVKQERYTTPAAYITGKEAYTNFDPVETALFFSVPGEILVKLIIMGLMDKNIIKMTSTKQLKREATLEKLTWYEELFLDVIDKEVNIKPEKWTDFCRETLDKLKEMLGGYCGAQTKAYYQRKLADIHVEENTDPRWLVLKDYLNRKIYEKPKSNKQYEPVYLNSYLPIFYLSFIDNDMERERKAAFTKTFTSSSSGGHSGGSSCACACACACASSGGCT